MNESSPFLSPKAFRALLGLRRPVPLTLGEMVKCLAVVFVPGTRETPRLRRFGEKLREGFAEIGVRVLPPSEALGTSGQLREGVVPIYLGKSGFDFLSQGDLPVRNLHSNPMVGIFDRSPPTDEQADLQTRLSSSTAMMAEHLVTLCIYVTDETWTMATMNGAVVDYPNAASIAAGLLGGFVPKVAAKVVPPRLSDITTSFESLDLSDTASGCVAADFAAAAAIWAKDGSMSAHVPVDSLPFRSPLHRALVASYLDERNGMSYGFLAWQLPFRCDPALTLAEGRARFGEIDEARLEGVFTSVEEGKSYVRVAAGGEHYLCAVPPVSVLCTRSGCRKDAIDPRRDLVRLTLEGGKVLLETPSGSNREGGCRPSYDTYTILANALGNALVASLLKRLRPDSRFVGSLEEGGLSLSHWHGYLDEGAAPEGYLWHGAENPGVCCATSQSAIYSLSGKLEGLDLALREGSDFEGDVHVEPHHGTNLCGRMSLCAAAALVTDGRRAARPAIGGSE